MHAMAMFSQEIAKMLENGIEDWLSGISELSEANQS